MHYPRNNKIWGNVPTFYISCTTTEDFKRHTLHHTPPMTSPDPSSHLVALQGYVWQQGCNHTFQFCHTTDFGPAHLSNSKHMFRIWKITYLKTLKCSYRFQTPHSIVRFTLMYILSTLCRFRIVRRLRASGNICTRVASSPTSGTAGTSFAMAHIAVHRAQASCGTQGNLGTSRGTAGPSFTNNLSH